MLIGVPGGFSVGQTLKVFIAATSLAQQGETARVVCASMEVLKRVVDPKSTKLSDH